MPLLLARAAIHLRHDADAIFRRRLIITRHFTILMLLSLMPMPLPFAFRRSRFFAFFAAILSACYAIAY